MDCPDDSNTDNHDEQPSGSYLLLLSGRSASLAALSDRTPVQLVVEDDGSLRALSEPVDQAVGTIVTRGDELTLLARSDGPLTVNGDPVQGAQTLDSGDIIAAGSSTAVVHHRPATWAAPPVLVRRDLLQRLHQESERSLRYGSSLSVLVIHLSERGAGSASPVLQAVVDAVRRVDIVGRGQRDEIVVLLPETGESASVPAARVLSALAPLCSEVTAGLAICPTDGTDPDALLTGARSAARSAAAGQVQPMSDTDEELRIGDLPVIAVDPKTQELLALARRLAASDIPVLITGETGVGKEVFAQAIHHWSPRTSGPLVSVNCAVLPDSMTEGVLFGHERGAFTGAEVARPGLVEGASGGTLLLDEVSEASARSQAELLRVLETQRVRRLGAVDERTVDVRLIAATNRTPEELLNDGPFRRDLFYRLSGATLVVPPLRERMLDLPPLARAFLRQACERQGRRPLRLSAEAMQRLAQHDWPGNVRELRNLADYLVAVVDGDVVRAADLPERIAQQTAPWLRRPAAAATSETSAPPPPVAPERPAQFRKLSEEIQELERTRMEQALATTGGVRIRAAELIGMPLRTFVTKLKSYGIGGKPNSGDGPSKGAPTCHGSAVSEGV